jgi:hypothetical protein
MAEKSFGAGSTLNKFKDTKQSEVTHLRPTVMTPDSQFASVDSHMMLPTNQMNI